MVEVPLQRHIPRFPYVPSDARERDQRCFEAYNIQVHGLLKRLASTGLTRVVIGVSGGLDSTQALIVAAKTMDRMGLPRQEHPGLHHAGIRHQQADPRQRALADERPGGHRGRD